MNLGPVKLTAKAVILVCFTGFVVFPVLLACYWKLQDWRYVRFCWRGQEYYAQVANACDQLLNQNEPLPRKMTGEKLKSLPPLLRELNPEFAVVDTNLVLVTLGGGMLSHQIIWKQAIGSSWELIIISHEARKSRILFSKDKPALSKPAVPMNAEQRLLRYIEHSESGAAAERSAIPSVPSPSR